MDVSMYCPHGDTNKYSGREDWSAEENRDEDIDLGASVCVCVCTRTLLCFVVEGVEMDAVV